MELVIPLHAFTHSNAFFCTAHPFLRFILPMHCWGAMGDSLQGLPSVPHNVNNNILLKLSSPVCSNVTGLHNSLRIIRIHMQNRRPAHPGTAHQRSITMPGAIHYFAVGQRGSEHASTSHHHMQRHMPITTHYFAVGQRGSEQPRTSDQHMQHQVPCATHYLQVGDVLRA